MSDERTESYSRDDLPESRTDWARFDALTDEEIESAVAGDPEAPPLLDEEFFRAAELLMPPADSPVPISIRVDREVLDFFKAQGPGYQSRINAVLRAYVRSRRSA